MVDLGRYDGNGNGIPDGDERNVETVISGGNNLVTIEAPAALTINVTGLVLNNNNPRLIGSRMYGLAFGLTSFRATGLAAGSTVV